MRSEQDSAVKFLNELLLEAQPHPFLVHPIERHARRRYFVAVRRLQLSIPETVAAHDANNVTPSDFAVVVTNLPSRIAKHSQSPAAQ